MYVPGDVLSGNFSTDPFIFRTRHGWVAQSIHDDGSLFDNVLWRRDVGVFVEYEEHIHEVAPGTQTLYILFQIVIRQDE